MRCASLFLIALGCGAAIPAFAQDLVGDPARGRALALKTCAVCHKVNKGEKGEKMSLAPPFQDVANERTVTPMSLRVFLRSPHKNMPNLVLTRDETDDVVAYILSLRRSPR